ncbi:hypothetical protein JTB14_011991 [Gonioctena quinquepunctata]|nr:hypothetical protein JTB14_011991 [Gonioctena quinquepunctata]
MSLKFTLFLALLVIVVSTKAHVVEEQTPLKNDIDDLLQKLRDTVDKAMAQAQEALDQAKAAVDKTAQETEDSASAAMQSTIEKFKKEIDELKEKAKNAGVNIDDCLGADEQKLLNLPNELSGDMVHCVSDKVDQGIGYAQDALNKIQKIVDDVENIKQEIKDCGHGFKSVKCLAKLALKIEGEITSLPTEIEVDVAATVALIAQLDEQIEKCASDKTDECESEGEALVEKISVCVAAKIIT